MNKTGHIGKDCKEKPGALKAILDAGPSSQRPAVMCVQLSPPRSAQLVDHLRPVKPGRSNGNRFQPSLANAGFWESVAPDASTSACPTALSASDFPPLSAHLARQVFAFKVSIVHGEIDRINKTVFVDNPPPVGNGGSPSPA